MDWELIYQGKRYYWRRIITSQEIYDRTKLNRSGGYIYTATIENVKPPITNGGVYYLSYLMKIKGE